MKILIVITTDKYIRNYFDTNAFSEIEENTYAYVAVDTIHNKDYFKGKESFLGFYKLDEDVVYRHYELLNVLMWRYRKRSKTFLYRFLMLYWPKTAHWYNWDRKSNFIKRHLRKIYGLKYPILGNKLLAPLVIRYMKRKLIINKDMKRYIESFMPDLVIFPSSAYDPIGSDLTLLGSKMGFSTLFLIDNWDNISGKSVMWTLPDYLGVWGQQSKDLAVKIHKMNPENITNIGTPRFEKYFSRTLDDDTSPYAFPYILLCGCAEPFDEITALKLLDKEIDENKDTYGDLKVVYRPHPGRQRRMCFDSFKEEQFDNVILDRQSTDYYNQKKHKGYQPALDYYPALLKSARLVIAPLTTMIMESLVCGTKVLALVYDDGVHFTSPHNTFKYYVHFNGVERINGLFFCNKQEELGPSMGKVFLHPKINKSDMLSSLKYFLYHDSLPYCTRLKHLVDKIEKHTFAN